MNGQPCEQFFLQPVDAAHRRYEALRAVFVERQPLANVAQRFGVSHGTVRNWACQFRSQWEAGAPPPFSFHPRRAAPPAPPPALTRSRTRPRSPTPKRSA